MLKSDSLYDQCDPDQYHQYDHHNINIPIDEKPMDYTLFYLRQDKASGGLMIPCSKWWVIPNPNNLYDQCDHD